MPPLYESFASRQKLYLHTLDHFLNLLEKTSSPPYVPPLIGLRRRMEEHSFHITPEVFFQIGGRVLFELPSEKFFLRTDKVCLIPTGMPHRETRFHGRKPFHQVILMFQRKSISFHTVYSLPDRTIIGSPVDLFPTIHRNTIVDYLEQMSDSDLLPSSSVKKFRCNIFHSLMQVARHIVAESSNPNRNVPFKISRCLGIVDSNLHDPHLSVRNIAKSISCAPDYLSRLFRQHMDINLNEYINQSRVNLVKDHLRNSDLSIKEIAWSAGYRDPAYLNRVFRNHTGLTPNTYRKQPTQKKRLVIPRR